MAVAALVVLAAASCGERDGGSAPAGARSGDGVEEAQPRPAAELEGAAGQSGDPATATTEWPDPDPGPASSPAGDRDPGAPPSDGPTRDAGPASSPAGDTTTAGDRGHSGPAGGGGQPEPVAPRPPAAGAAPEPGPQQLGPGPALQLDESAADQYAPEPIEDGATVQDAGQDSSTGSPGGVPYTYHDGDAERRVWLVPGAQEAAPDSGGGTAGDLVADGQSGGGGSLVFVSESGTEMTLPGGVALVLDPEWSAEQVDGFLAVNGISRSRASDLGWIANGFLIATEPGLASLELANALATLEGVVISSPNWSSGATLN